MNTITFWIFLVVGALVIAAIWWSETWDDITEESDEPDEHAEYPGETRRPWQE